MLDSEFKEKTDELLKKIYILAGEEFNVSSPKQLGEILFVKLGLPAPDLTLLLKVPVEKSLELIDVRGEKKDIHENRDHLKKAALAAEKCAASWGWESLSCVNEKGELLSREEIAERVYQVVCHKIF